ncbi:MAG: indole-3-glycerol phosphate synthase TrpC [Candidatus Omnitrophica bacterium]|nr:indole-3-glycerol phosphate synthase TrpC [Candidatus Omnitrophota bacterium]
MKSVLKNIVAAKKKEVARAKKAFPLTVLLSLIKKNKIKCRNFDKSISLKSGINCIGELKKASPLKGILRKNLDLAKTAKIYEQSGAAAVSVHTDSHFYGKLSDIGIVKNNLTVPVLRKDFIIDEYQIYESFIAGADAVLLIAAILSKQKISRLLQLTYRLGMSALVEVHNRSELKKIDFRKVRTVGINNRDLNSFKVKLKTTEEMIALIPKGKIIVSESGIQSRKDVLYLQSLGVRAVLIGEGIVRARNMGIKIKNLLGKS